MCILAGKQAFTQGFSIKPVSLACFFNSSRLMGFHKMQHWGVADDLMTLKLYRISVLNQRWPGFELHIEGSKGHLRKRDE